MEYHRISLIHNDTEHLLIKAIDGNLTEYVLMSAYRIEVANYMEENNLGGNYILTGMSEA